MAWGQTQPAEAVTGYIFEPERRHRHSVWPVILDIHRAHNMLADPKVIADRYSEATVRFADIVEFTRFSAGIQPRWLVEILNDVFSAFDRLGLEKIKTIGDAYVAVGGLPTPRSDRS